ncbi:unnamed protein product [Cuscuta campestris]|uniref:Uncharacterized protein n=1 Tax=Cuscuta campestris TaxID=132261 RepID=A0A484M0E8_9ASTE|nr:unnamed protein product [Cuscuta campestris]
MMRIAAVLSHFDVRDLDPDFRRHSLGLVRSLHVDRSCCHHSTFRHSCREYRHTTEHLENELVLGDWCIDIVQPVGKILQLLTISCHGGVALDCGTKFMLQLHGPGMFVVVEQIVDDFPESRGSRNRGDYQIGDLIGDGRENPTLEESVELEPFVVVIREGGDRAIDVALEIEPSNQKEEQPTPLLVIRLREAKLNWNMEFHVGYSCESKMWGFGGEILRGDLANFGHGEGEMKERLPVGRWGVTAGLGAAGRGGARRRGAAGLGREGEEKER